MTSPSITQHLLNLNPAEFQKATQNPFLSAAGSGTLSKEILQQWLSQDRLYAQAYVRFASHLISTISLPTSPRPEDINERYFPLLSLYPKSLFYRNPLLRLEGEETDESWRVGSSTSSSTR